MPIRELRARLLLPILSTAALVFSVLSPISIPTAKAAPALVTCVNLVSEKERVSRTGKCRIGQEAQANWRKSSSDSAISLGAKAKVITTCSEKENSPTTYRVIRKKCARNQITTNFSRSTALPAKPIIAEAVSHSHDSAALKLATDPADSLDAPVAYYTITPSQGDTQKVYSWGDLRIAISGLRALTTYTFTVTATTVDGTSEVSIASIPVTTSAYVPPRTNSTSGSISAPIFTLSKSAETTTANISRAGFGYSIVDGGGGAVDSYSISPTLLPAGLSFSTSSGLITGTPTETKTATTYTITGTNSVGSASATYRLRVTGDIGDIGPGGGKIFYYLAAGFNCGASFTDTGSPTGGKCKYLEVAPVTWITPSDSTTVLLGNRNDAVQVSGVRLDASVVFDANDVGLGYKNSIALRADSRAIANTGIRYVRDYNGGSLSDWYVPNSTELNLLVYWSKNLTPNVNARCGSIVSCTIPPVVNGDFNTSYYYYSSSETGANPFQAYIQSFANGIVVTNQWSDTGMRVRPIRAF